MLIQYESDDFLIAFKPHGIPTLPQKNDKKTTLPDLLFSTCCGVNFLSEEHNFGILHRLDSCTEGLVLVAKNIDSYNFFKEEQKKDRIKKTYIAICSARTSFLEGFPGSCPKITENTHAFSIKSCFRPFGVGRKVVRPVLFNDFGLEKQKKTFAQKKAGSRVYTTMIKSVEKGYFLDDGSKQIQYKITCQITNGFRHQIRSHLSWAGFSIIGDFDYGGTCFDFVNLSAIGLEFFLPNECEPFVFFC